MVAINKIDKEDADPSHVRQQLLTQGLELEEAGGDVQVQLDITTTRYDNNSM